VSYCPYLFAYADSGEQAGAVVDDVLAQSEMPVLVIVDSIMAMVPLIELTSEMDQNLMGKQPQLINRIIRIANARLKKAKVGKCARTTLLLINQTRDQIGAMPWQHDPGFSSGGAGRKFFAGVRVVFSSSTPEKEDKGTKGLNSHVTRYGKKVNYQVIKNKCGGPEETGHFVFYNRERKDDRITYGFDNAEALIAQGLLYEILSKRGNFVYYGNKQLGNCVASAMKYLRMSEHSDIAEKLAGEIMLAAKLDFGGTDETEA